MYFFESDFLVVKSYSVLQKSFKSFLVDSGKVHRPLFTLVSSVLSNVKSPAKLSTFKM